MKSNEALRKNYFDQKRSEFELGCSEGKSTACFSLGEWHQLIAKDYAKAAEIYDKNCLQRHHGNSCFNLALLYHSGRLNEKEPVPDVSPAKKSQKETIYSYFDKACTFGNSQACGQLALRMLKGVGCKKDVEGALGLLEKACEENDAGSCVTLAGALLRPKDPTLKRDPKRAFKSVEHGCNLGHPNACQILAVMYKKGEGVEADPEMHEKYKQRTKDIIKQTGEKMGIDVI